MKVSIFCSANSNIDPDFFAETEKLGTWLAQHGHEVVFGGCNLGLMECVARAAHDAGGRTIGIIPHIIEENGKRSRYVDEAVFCDSLSERKDLLLERGDVIIALPGGIGTLDEVFTVAAAYTIGYHRKPVILYNMKGFWSSLIAMLDDLASKGVIRGNWRDYIRIANSLDEITRHLS
ncbi:MAG: TIGR00730 family Rossman fold protein [Prevotella sp.]|nr:TIGR00730 family Rossman fold protein [Prevotella sp.]